MIHLAYQDMDVSSDGRTLRVRTFSEPKTRLCDWFLPLFGMTRREVFDFAPLDALVAGGESFFYPVEIYGQWSRLWASFQGSPPVMVENVPSAVIEAARAGRCVVLFFCAHEGGSMALPKGLWVYDFIQNWLVAAKVPPAVVMFVEGNVAADFDVALWRRQRRLFPHNTFRHAALWLYESFLKAGYRRRLAGQPLSFAVQRSDDGASEVTLEEGEPDRPFSDCFVTPDIIERERAGEHRRSKVFLSFNRGVGGRAHRLSFVASLAGEGLLENGHVSMNDHPGADGSIFPFLSDPALVATAQRGWSELRPRLPLSIDVGQTLSRSTVMIGTLDPHAWPFRDSYLHFVTETWFADDRVLFVSEKVARPIANLQPFVVVGAPFTLRYLRSVGYRTFGTWFDESYDEEVDPTRRMAKVLKLAGELGRLPLADARALYLETEPALRHNLATFLAAPCALERELRKVMPEAPVSRLPPR